MTDHDRDIDRLPDEDSFRPIDPADMPVLPGDVASAGRSCSVVIILLAVVLVLVCLSVAIRWQGGA
jgi:hypothetical protein